MLIECISELTEMPPTANLQWLINYMRQQVPDQFRGEITAGHRRGSPLVMGVAHTLEWFAEPQPIFLDVPGWEQQMIAQPWRPISPSYVANVGKHNTQTLEWIIRHDAKYVKWVLTHAEKLQEPAMETMRKYFQEHYMPSDPYHLVKRRKLS